jgi:hypothetical protein
VEAVISGGPMPVPVDVLFDTTLTTLAAEESLRAGRSVPLSEFWEEPEAPAAGSDPSAAADRP